MRKVVKAEYDAASHALRLIEPFEGLDDREQVDVMIDKHVENGTESWRPFVGCLAGPAGDDFARAIDELFPIEQ